MTRYIKIHFLTFRCKLSSYIDIKTERMDQKTTHGNILQHFILTFLWNVSPEISGS